LIVVKSTAPPNVKRGTRERRLRQYPWILRLLIFAVVFVCAVVLIITGTRIVYALTLQLMPGWSLGTAYQDLVFRLSFLAAALVAGLICTRWVEGLPGRAIGLSLHHGWLRHFLIGSIVGIVSLGLASAIATAGGGLSFTMFAPGEFAQVARTAIVSAPFFIIAALAEEVFARGYPLQTMSRAGLPGLGVLITALGFAGLHVLNPSFSKGLPFINLLIAGVWLGGAYLRTRSLWFPLGIHWAWNWALGSLLGLPVSGKALTQYSVLRGTDLGPAWLTGGNFGIEGGIACTAAIILSTIFVLRTKLVTADEQMRRLTSEQPAGIGIDNRWSSAGA
jgi:uncharacterized protein